MKIVDGKAVPKSYVILKVKNACYGLHCAVLLHLSKCYKLVIWCIQMNCIYFGGYILLGALKNLRSFEGIFHSRTQQTWADIR